MLLHISLFIFYIVYFVMNWFFKIKYFCLHIARVDLYWQKHMFKQWWSIFQPMSTKRAITSFLKCPRPTSLCALCKTIRVNVEFGLLLESDWKGVKMFCCWNFISRFEMELHVFTVSVATTIICSDGYYERVWVN